MKRIEAFIFDLDGTLLDSEVLLVEATRQALERRGCHLSYDQTLDLAYGKGWSVVWGEVCEKYPGLYGTSEEM